MDTQNNTHFLHIIVKILGVFLVTLLCQQAFAGTSITITCTDPADPLTCTTTGSSPDVSTALLDFVTQLNDFKDALPKLVESGICEVKGLKSTLCHFGDVTAPLDVLCIAGINNRLACGIPNDPNGLSIVCSKDTTASSCTINTERNLIPEILLGSNLGSFSTVFAGACDGDQQDSFICQQFNNPSLTDEDKIKILEAIQPLNPDAALDVMSTNLKQSLSTISQRLSRIRTGVAVLGNSHSQQYLVNNEWHEDGTLFADNTNVANDASVTVDKNISEFGKLGVFINVSFIKAKQGESDAELNSDSDSSVITIGTDYRFSEQLVGGLAFNMNNSKTQYDETNSSGKLNSDGYSLLLYSSYYFNSWFFDSSLSIGGDDYESTRNPIIAFDPQPSSYNADYFGQQTSISGSVGYDFHIQSINITPFAQLIFGKVTTDQYHETKTNPLASDIALAMEEQSRDMGTLNLGSQVNYIITTEKGVFIPSFSLILVNDFKNDAQIVTGHFIASPGSDFSLTTNEIDSSYFLMSFGGSFQLKGGNSGFLNIETIEGFDNLQQQRYTAGWRWEI